MHKFFERHDNWSQYVASDNYKAKALCMKPVFALREEKFGNLSAKNYLLWCIVIRENVTMHLNLKLLSSLELTLFVETKIHAVIFKHLN